MALPASGYFSDTNRTVGEVQQAFEDQRDFIAGSTEADSGTNVVRDANGTFKVGAPTDPAHPVRLDYLGTAATANVTTSATDTTSGRLLKVGDFGVGSSGMVLNQDTLSRNGLYMMSTTVPSVAPNFSPYLHMGDSVNYAQLISRRDTESWFVRSYYGGAWQPYRQLYHTGNTIVDSNGFIKQA